MVRQSGKLNARNKFYIITNGEQTEKNYFDLLKAKRSIYNVKVLFQNADPLGLVEFAMRYTDEANQVWCVFDIDYSHENKRLIPSLKKAEENKIKIAYSNVAFEVWLISHFEKCDKPLQIADYEHTLNRLLHIENKILNYSKTDGKLLKKHFIPKYKCAIENAKIVYQKYVKEHNEHSHDKRLPIWDWNSSTTVYKLVEALQLRD